MVQIPALPNRLRRTSAVAAACVAAVAGVALAGWALEVAVMRSLFPGWPPMPPETALGLLLAGIGVWCVSTWNPAAPAHWRRQLVAGCAGLLLALAALRLLAYAIGWSVPFARSPLPIQPDGLAAGMAPLTAFCFLLLGSALAVVRSDRTQAIVFQHGSAILVCIAGWLGLSRYFFGGAPLVASADMAAHTAIGLMALGGALLIVRPEVGLMRVFISDTFGGILLRRVLPTALVLPVVVGWTRLLGQRAGWFGMEAGMSLSTMANVGCFGVLLWVTAAHIRRSDLRQQETTRRLAYSESILAKAQSLAHIGSIEVQFAGSEPGREPRFWSRETYSILGYAYGEVEPSRKAFEARVHPDDRDVMLRGYAEAMANGEKEFRYQYRVVHPGGALRHIDGHTEITYDGDGRPQRVFSALQDITERKDAEARIQTQLSRLNLLGQVTRAIGEHQDPQSIYQIVIRTMEEQLPADFACVCHYDQQAHSLTVIRVGVKGAGLAMELALAEYATIPIDKNGLSRCVKGHLVYEPDVLRIDFPFPRRLAQAGLRAVVFAPLIIESRVFGVLVLGRTEPASLSSVDCEFILQLSGHVALASHQADLYRSLLDAYDDLRQSQQVVLQHERLRSIGQMASGIAHDINNAMSPVLICTESLLEREPGLSPRARRYLGTIQVAVNDVTQTVTRLRDFSRQRDGSRPMLPMELNRLVRHVMDLTRVRWSDMPQQLGKDITARIELAPDLPHVLGVENEMRDALTNLVINAVDAMPDGGRLTVRSLVVDGPDRSSGRRVRIEVADTGIGMDEQTRQRCLEPFFTTKGERGTGLGLAMVYGAAQRHEADFAIHSEVGKGTTISLEFAAYDGPLLEAGAAAPSAPVPHLRLLVIDDDPLILKALQEMLEDDGHDVAIANGGQAGIDRFAAGLQDGQRFAAVITDLGMPHVDGRQVAHAIKAAAPATPVILLTGWGQRLREDDEIPPHVDDLLSKPPKLRDLRQALRRVAAAGA